MLPDLDDVLSQLHVVALPLIQRFRGIQVRYAALFEGPAGWTEFSPFLEYDAQESSTWLAAAYDFGWHQPPTPLRPRVAVNATVPAVTPDEVAGILARFPGCRTAKVKVAQAGQSLDADVARVRTVRELMGPEGAIRIDANGGWSLDEAQRALEAMAPFDLEYAEQPCASVSELATLRAQMDGRVDIAADESIRRAEDPQRVALAGAADVIVVKAQPLGGIHRSLRVVDHVGLPAVVSSALDTSVGLAMGAFLAAALPEARDAGLGTAALLAADVSRDPLVPVAGAIDVRRVEPDRALLDAHRADDEATTWWRERVIACHRILRESAEAD